MTKSLLPASPNFKTVPAQKLKFVRYTIISVSIELILKTLAQNNFNTCQSTHCNNRAHCPRIYTLE